MSEEEVVELADALTVLRGTPWGSPEEQVTAVVNAAIAGPEVISALIASASQE